MDHANDAIDKLILQLEQKGVILERYEDLRAIVRDVPLSTRRAIGRALAHGVADDTTVDRWPPPVLDPDEQARCYIPPSFPPKGIWGISTQLYELKSSRNWGIGDFEDLKYLCSLAAEVGADFIGLNPLHALFMADPSRCSPYSPSNRRYLNPLYLAVDKIAGFRSEWVDPEKLRRARETDHVNYGLVAEIKVDALKHLWDVWAREGLPDDALTCEDFEVFKREGGEPLAGHALFECMSAHMRSQGFGCGWTDWPVAYHQWDSEAVQVFAAVNRDNIDFYIWLQWITALQLEEVATHARNLRMRVGLYLDFAVGEVPDGSSTWSEPDLVLAGLHIGAPPDAFSARGQDWGLVPLSPVHLFDAARHHYRDLVDRTARFAGALRLDHALGLWQFFLIPSGETPAAGGYVRFPFRQTISHLAVISQNRETIMIGEDLGNVPEGFRPALAKAQLLAYRVLYFEEMKPTDKSAQELPSLSLACLSTHDLPPILGWWAEDDIGFAKAAGFLNDEVEGQLRQERRGRKRAMLSTVIAFNLFSPDRLVAVDERLPPADIIVALHRLLAQTSSLLVAARLADMVGERSSTNVPGTLDEYPNWCLKLKMPLEDMAKAPLFSAVAEALRADRPRL